jgi:hypothetical protein
MIWWENYIYFFVSLFLAIVILVMIFAIIYISNAMMSKLLKFFLIFVAGCIILFSIIGLTIVITEWFWVNQ